MHDVVSLGLLDEAVIALLVSHIELLVFTWEVELLVCAIACYDSVGTELFDKCIDEGDSDLTLAASEQDSAFLPGSVLLISLIG